MKCSVGQVMALLKSNKPYLGVLLIQFVNAGRSLFNKAAISNGMNPYVFVAYGQAFASVVLAPFAIFFESHQFASLSFNLLCKIFFVSLFGLTVSFNLNSLSMDYVSATFTMAISNTVPAITFIMALLLRMESIAIREWHGVAKLVGSIVSLGGAMVFILIKGPPIYSLGRSHKELSSAAPSPSNNSESYYSRGDWLKGSLICVTSNIGRAFWIIMQGPLTKQYPAILRLTALQTFFSCIQSVVWAAAAERNISSWKLRWDVNLLSVIYCGAVAVAINSWLRIWVINKKGPVFLAMFTPLGLPVTAFLSAVLWKESLHWGSLCGALLLVGGLYGYLWGRHQEGKVEKEEKKPAETTQETV
ncbi:WAT1-related protein At1g43650-like [Diospyros lotus]|uniref:WAT1-related protein At1g43650-like n=1 Tax=Diospyros lotus TaxID=55363 RepID=UPI0022504F52|nr:WAT1-related protein At1g43650-like [Diospyros lotus]